MPKLPVISGKEFVKFLINNGFSVIRTKGSHVRLSSHDGRFTTIPVHENRDLPKGLIRKVIREDLELELNEFILLWENFKR